MPRIYQYFGLIFFFYSNDHLPIHVHVSLGERESRIIIQYEYGKLKEMKVETVKGRNPLTAKDINHALKFVKNYHTGIVEKWMDFFVKNKKVKFEIIDKKI